MTRLTHEVWGYHTACTVSALFLFFAASWTSLMFYNIYDASVLVDPLPGTHSMWLASSYNSMRRETGPQKRVGNVGKIGKS